jgi:hypothetical protein
MLPKNPVSGVAVNEDDYQIIADCIRSGQVPESALMELMQENVEFARWYHRKYVDGSNNRDDSPSSCRRSPSEHTEY